MGGILINAGVINYGGTPSIGANASANRPAAGVKGRLFVDTTNSLLQYDTGSAWTTIGGGGGTVLGTGAPFQVAFWTTPTGTLTGSNNFFWDGTNNRLGLGTNAPGVRLDVHSTNVIAQFNGTTTNNAYLDFQNAGSTQWRIGNTYNAAQQRFSIFNAAGTTENFTILQGGNIGIGINLPVEKLSVYSDINNTNRISLINPNLGTAAESFLFASTTGNRYLGLLQHGQNKTGTTAGLSNASLCEIQAGGDNSAFLINQGSSSSGIFFALNSTIRMSILNSSGNIGIGYASPAAILSVAGSALINTNTANALYELFVNGNIYTGGLSPTISTQGTSVAMTRTQCGYVCTATLTLTLPSASGLNNFYFVVANTGATVTVQRAGTDTILDKLGVSQTSVIVAASTRSMFYVGGGTITYQIF